MTDTVYPLIFTYRDAVSGKGFLAGVTVTGKALITKEEDQWWMYGVRPAGLADTGKTPDETFLHFRERYRYVLFDIAGECETFDQFRREVERFFYEADTDEEERWLEAHLKIRSGEITPGEPFAGLKKEAPETRPASISVVNLDNEQQQRLMPTDNVPDTYIMPIAA